MSFGLANNIDGSSHESASLEVWPMLCPRSASPPHMSWGVYCGSMRAAMASAGHDLSVHVLDAVPVLTSTSGSLQLDVLSASRAATPYSPTLIT